jgi:hypothetical protein
MALVLKYPANCYKCGKRCDPQEERKKMREDKNFKLSFLHRDYKDRKWKAHCYPCYEITKKQEIT